ncbi:hypothetical protein WMZ97_17395 [Lentibacillus sp. N15]|uniref:hypothetical protein n=1 Tax=Lentibacillus songyuanensis TaxID=3136161 RepID=UPI0031BA038C
MRESNNQTSFPFTLEGNYYSFFPVMLPGIFLFAFAFFQETSNWILNITVSIFYVIVISFLFFMKPKVTITDNDIIIKWLYNHKYIKAHLIKKIVLASSNSILIYKYNKKLPIQLSFVYGFKINLLYPRLAVYAKKHNIMVEHRVKEYT